MAVYNYLKRVGIDSTYGGRWSLIDSNETFHFIPIPEEDHVQSGLTYAEIFSGNIEIQNHLGPDLWNRFAHFDPDFNKFVYGAEGTLLRSIDSRLIKMIKEKDNIVNIYFYSAFVSKHDSQLDGYYIHSVFRNCRMGKESDVAASSLRHTSHYLDPDLMLVCGSDGSQKFERPYRIARNSPYHALLEDYRERLIRSSPRLIQSDRDIKILNKIV